MIKIRDCKHSSGHSSSTQLRTSPRYFECKASKAVTWASVFFKRMTLLRLCELNQACASFRVVPEYTENSILEVSILLEIQESMFMCLFSTARHWTQRASPGQRGSVLDGSFGMVLVFFSQGAGHSLSARTDIGDYRTCLS
jgi:hypothetical protein